ncbi:MAG TPA: DNA translocase FtsK 4TM domain-containing protein, partial [Deltaproteobacteria bacterium]|nr:DNA translocase FtsK 4TM domain-containing protein [Deltaproteobacteria bacterium]
MAKKSKENRIPFPILGIFLAFVAVFLFLSLVSYDPADPSFSHYEKAQEINNWMGIVGSYIADGLFITFGLMALVIPFFLAEYAVRFFRKTASAGWVKLMSIFIIFFACLGLLDIFVKDVSLFSATMNAGGGIGKIIGGSLYKYLNAWGSLMLLLMLLCAGAVIGYDFATPYHTIKEFTGTVRENWEVRVKRREMEKRTKPKPQKKNSDDPAFAEPPKEQRSEKKEPQITISSG